MLSSLFLGGALYAAGVLSREIILQVGGAGLITLALALRVVDHLRSRRAYAAGRYFTRTEDRAAYWLIVAIFVVAVSIATWFVVALVRGTIVIR